MGSEYLEQQQYPRYPNDYPSQTMDETHLGIMRDQQNTEQVKFVLAFDDVLLKSEYFLRGWTFDPKVGDYKPSKGCRPYMNDNGVNSVLRQMEMRLSRVFSLSQYERIEIDKVMQLLTIYLIEELFIKANEYELNPVDIPIIVNELVDSMHATLKKAKDGKLQSFLKDTTRSTETRRIGQESGRLTSGIKKLFS